MDPKDIQLIIPMAGIGKRFIDAGYNIPKTLIELDGYPIIKHILDMFPGVEDISFICNETHIKNTDIEKQLLKLRPKAKIFSIPNHKLGPVFTVSQIFSHIDSEKPVIVTYCDCASYWNFNKFLKEIEKFDGSVLSHIGFHPIMLGTDNYASCFHNNNILSQIKEKEPVSDRLNTYMSAGTYYFKSGRIVKKYFQKLIDLNIHINNEYYVSLVYNLMIQDGLKINIFEVENMLNWGTPYDLEEYKSWSNYFWNFEKQGYFVHDTNTTLIIPMAGKGSRFGSKYYFPKPLIQINGAPMFVKAINSIPHVDNKIFIVLQEHIDNFSIDKEIKNYFPNAKILAVDKVTQGQACTCELAIKTFNLDLNKPILISACDNGVIYNPFEYSELIKDIKNDIIVWSFRNNQTSRIKPNSYSWLLVDKDNNILQEYSKFCPFKDSSKDFSIIGTMFFRKAKYFIEALNYNINNNIRTNNEYYVDDLLNYNIENGLKVKNFEADHYACWGMPEELNIYLYWKNYFLKKYNLSIG